MSNSAGLIIHAEAISASVEIYAQAGGGSAGIGAVRSYLREQNRDATERTIETVIRYVQATLDSARGYRSGGPDYTPRRSDLPDARRIERAAGITPPVRSAGGPTGTVFHEVEIQIIDPTTGLPWYTQSGTIEDANVLSRRELEERAAQEVLGMLRALDTVPAATGRDHIDFQVRVRFRGAWIGY